MIASTKKPQEPSKQRRYHARKSLMTSDIHPMPAVKDKARKDSCRDSLRLFLETYFKEAFPLSWSSDHLEILAGVEEQIETGGSIAIAMPRGSGKTTIIIRAAIWAILYGKSPYVMIVAADAAKAKKLLKAIKHIFRTNQVLFEDFPEVCHPVRCLQGQAINANKQHCNGIFTLMDWKDSTAQLPTVEGSVCSGSMIEVAGVTAAARGAQVTLDTGEVLRPTLVLIDDFQTRESAASITQSKTRMEIIAGDLAGMKGPDQPLAMLAAITVIYKGDAADEMLNREKHPLWRGVRKQMVLSWPNNEALWDKYAELRLDAIRNEQPTSVADQFYIDNQEEMDKGSEVSWPERKEQDISAIQHAYNIRLRIGEEAFNAEYQNSPDDPNETSIKFLTDEELCAKVNGLRKGDIPDDCTRIVAAIDVQTTHLWYCIVGWSEGFTGTILDYGTWPAQKRKWYTKRTLPIKFGDVPELEGKSEEESIVFSVKSLVDNLAKRKWVTDAGISMDIHRIIVDEGYQPDSVHLAIKQSEHRRLLIPAKGIGIKAGATTMAEWPKRKGEPRPKSAHWRHRATKATQRSVRSLHWDTNYWKTFLQKLFIQGQGARGCLSFWGKNKVAHRLPAAHVSSQVPHVKEHGTKEIVEWEHKPAKPDDDLLDCLAMCCVAGSEQGLTLVEKDIPKRPSREAAKGKGLTVAEYMAARRAKS